jgi:zinc protease
VGLVQVCFHTPEARHPDIYPLALLARILSDGVTTRLYQKLVDGGLAISVHAQVTHLHDPSLFEIVAVVKPGVAHQDVQEEVLSELQQLKQTLATEAELERAKRKVEADVFFERDGALNFACALGEAESSADWRWFLSYVSHIQQVDLHDIQRVANHYFNQDNCTVGWFVPKESLALETEFNEGGKSSAE